MSALCCAEVSQLLVPASPSARTTQASVAHMAAQPAYLFSIQIGRAVRRSGGADNGAAACRRVLSQPQQVHVQPHRPSPTQMSLFLPRWLTYALIVSDIPVTV